MVATLCGAGVALRRGAIPVPVEFAAAVGPAAGGGFGGGINRRGVALGRMGAPENILDSSVDESSLLERPLASGMTAPLGMGSGIGFLTGK
jgi:hypothetical protein